MLRAVSRNFRRIFRKQKRELYEPDAGRLAEHLSGIPGASLIWCSCGKLLAPVVLGNSEETRVVAVGCLDCGLGLPVRVGLLNRQRTGKRDGSLKDQTEESQHGE